MLRKPLFWLTVSLLCLAGAIYFWRLGDKWEAQRKATAPATSQPQAKPVAITQPPPASAPIIPIKTAATTAGTKNRYPWRLSNTDKTSGQLLKSDKAIHLMNALIDTGKSKSLSVPDKLRAPTGNGSYVVQARGPLDNDFRALLQNAGATIVSYVPNNAYLVRVSDAGAQQLEAAAQTQAVMPFEPYYKLEPSLLNSVMSGSPLPSGIAKVTLFPGESSAALAALNIQVMATEPSPFGQVVTVPINPNTLVEIARLPVVQAVEPSYSRKFANDLDRVRLGVSANSLSSTPPYLGLTGSNVLVSINDSGVDMTHPDLLGRVFGDTTNALGDNDGHGTHVAGTILGDGAESTTVTNASGSVIPGASFSGMATNAHAYVISLDTAPSDAYLQEQPATTNALISNNSWNYGDAVYDIAAASYDAAVRDALPQVPGSQPLIFVFSAGNYGDGTDDGQNGDPDSILSPATAKNVITVGAIEQLRNITNTDVEDGQTNQPFLPSTDTDDEVASFSSRGNVGIQVEGNNGRFKPDLVAPGTFVISTRSTTWDTNAYYDPTNYIFASFPGQSVAPGDLDILTYGVPPDPVELIITISPNNLSPSPFPGRIPIYVALNQLPTSNNLVGNNQVILPSTSPSIPLNYGDTVFFAVGNPTGTTIDYDVNIEVVVTNRDEPELLALAALNNNLSAPPQYYRYESGTSMAAAGVTGMLACMEDFFINQLKITNASPALMKALLINGARSLSSPGQPYDFQVANSINFQGWGLPNLPNSIPSALTNFTANGSNTMPVLFFDQDPASALATGQSGTRTLQLSPDATSQPLRITLVWTDPPGNPNVGIKLVNDLDLIVTNMDTGDVYYGNDIPSGSIFNEVASTNGPSPADAVNNVENVYLPASTGTNFSITVYGHHVNVNAVTVNTNNVVQDYALVISTGDAGGSFTSPFTLGQPTVLSSNNVSPVTQLSNGVPLLNERIGANSQYATTTNGVTNNWNFYVYTNTASITNTSFTNVAIITFFPPDLGVPRMGASGDIDPASSNATRNAGADIDLYVSTDPNLTNLNPTVISNAFAQGTVSVGRTGDETVVFTNSAPGQVYYIGVKSEDQEGAQYGLAGIASDIPFSQTDSNGNTVITMNPLPAPIQGGSASGPQATLIFGVSTQNTPIRKVTVEDNITIQNFGDLIGTLSHGQTFVTLNNHTSFTNSNDTNETFIYDDSGEGDTPGSVHTVGPGSTLQNYVGGQASGSWIFAMVNDSGPTDSGAINSFQITVSPQPPTNGVRGTVVPGGWYYDFIDVPANCTNLTVELGIGSGGVPLDLYIKRGSFPTQTDYDKFAVINPPGGEISISAFDNPPLNPGRYYIAVFNPNTVAQTFFLSESLGLALTGSGGFQFLSVGNEPIPDDAVMYSTNLVGVNSPVVEASVGVRINHPRISDLVLTLISPQGTRVLLSENRGALTTNFGSGIDITNSLPETAAGDVSASTNTITLTNGQTAGTLVINYQFFTVPDDMRIYYGGVRIFDSGLISGGGTFAVNFGPGTSTNVEIIMNEPGTNPTSTNGDAWNYTATVITEAINYTVFTEDTNLTTMPIKFAPPPFGGGLAFVQPETVDSSGFEGFTNGMYNSVDGWTTFGGNPVTVVTVPQLAFLGSNVLALHQGSIMRTLPTVAGTTYTLTFAVHGRPSLEPVSWWKGDSNALDTVVASGNNGMEENSATYAPGLVGGAFDIIGFSDMRVPDATSLEFTNTMTAEAWIYPTNTSIGTQYSILTKFDAVPVGGSAYSLAIDGTTGDGSMTISPDGSTINTPVLTTTVIPANQWTHLAATYDGNLLSIYYNGTLQGQAVEPGGINPGFDDLSVGGTVGGEPGGGIAAPFSGLIDEATVYGNTLTIQQIQDIYAAGSAGKVGPLDSPQVNVTLNLGPLSTNVSAGDSWTNYSITFNATSNNMVLQVVPGTDGVLLDSVVLTQNAEANSNNYFLPEESLTKVVGQNALGAWQLEVLDNRAGPPSPNPPPVLVSWELNLLTETLTPSATPLTEAIPQSNTVPANYTVYYVVTVPPWALYATNTLFNVTGGPGAGPLNLIFNQNYEPGTTTNGGDYPLLTGVATSGSTNINTTNTAPLLIPGQQYYLGVQNTGTTPANFSIEVDFDITTLTNMVPVTNTLAASSVPRYYQFDVGTNFSAATFQLLNVTGNVDLVVSKGPPLPTLSVNDYGSTYFGSSNETITVLPNSAPVPLSPGRWYLGVFNNDITAQTYTIMASEYGPPIIIPLTNDVPFTTNFPPGPPLNTFFSFTITNTNSAVLYELYNLSGNVDLTLDRGTNNYPYQPPYFANSSNPGTNREQIVIRTNSALNATAYTTNLNDIWYLGVPNNETSNVTFTIRAVLDTNGVLPSAIPITVGIQSSTNGLTFTWPTVEGETYELVSTNNLLIPLTNWPIIATISNAPAYLDSYIDTNSITTNMMMFYSIWQVP